MASSMKIFAAKSGGMRGNMQKWYETEVDKKNVVISSRVRLARNLKNYCFDEKLKDKDAIELVSEIMSIENDLQKSEEKEYNSIEVNKLTDLEKTSMVEYHMMSPLLSEKKQRTGLLVSKDHGISIMINEEDHIRIQSVSSGMNMKKALERAEKIDDIISEKFEYAFDDKFGYLTSSPTNVGTGLRASYMLFLPALTMAGKIQKLADEVGKYGAQLSGIYGGETEHLGNIYQISNQKTLGSQENDIIDSLTQIVKQAVIQEKKRREYLLTVNGDEIEDKVFRSYGVLKYAKRLNTMDAMTLLAQLKLGVDTDIIRLKQDKNIFQMMMEIQPANLQKIIGKNIGSNERDFYRAEYINKALPELIA